MINKEQKLIEKIFSTTQDLKIGTIQSISESILVDRISLFRKRFTDTAVKYTFFAKDTGLTAALAT